MVENPNQWAAEAQAFLESKDINIPIRYAGILFTAVNQERDISAEDFFADTVIPIDKIHEQDYYISFDDFLTVCANGIKLTGTSEIALHFGKLLVLPAHGAWGLAVMTSPNLYEGIMLFRRYVTLELPFFIFDYQETDEHVTVEIKGTAAIQDNLQFHLEYIVMAEAINFLYAIKDNTDLEIHCEYPAPGYGDRYSEMIGRQVAFNSSFTGARFHKKHLPVSMPDANHASHLMLMKTLDDKAAEAEPKRTMSQIIVDYLGSQSHCYPEQETVAKQFNVSMRKLRYCLQDEGTSYKEIITNLKKQDALASLNGGVGISETAHLLGYEDPSNFTRAFKKWFGVSPSNFKSIYSKS